MPIVGDHGVYRNWWRRHGAYPCLCLTLFQCHCLLQCDLWHASWVCQSNHRFGEQLNWMYISFDKNIWSNALPASYFFPFTRTLRRQIWEVCSTPCVNVRPTPVWFTMVLVAGAWQCVCSEPPPGWSSVVGRWHITQWFDWQLYVTFIVIEKHWQEIT